MPNSVIRRSTWALIFLSPLAAIPAALAQTQAQAQSENTQVGNSASNVSNTSNVSTPSNAQQSSLELMDLSELLQQRVDVHRESDTASSISESLRDAPAAMLVIDQREIRRRGYDSLDDILPDLPGFDTVVTNGTTQVVSYQRGYRTPWTQRTLFLINGKVDNHLWNHVAEISRQYPINHIERIEVLYGPSGAVYGPNAFLGVINVITKTPDKLLDGENTFDISLQQGSFDTQVVDLASKGKHGDFSFSFGARWFESDEAHISDYSDWGYTQEDQLSNPDYWGAGIGAGLDPANPSVFSPAGDINVDGAITQSDALDGIYLGRYVDPTENRSLLGELYWNDWTLGLIHWKSSEGYGPYYSFMDGQPGGVWDKSSSQLYLNHVDHFKQDSIKVTSEFVYRESEVGGTWAESFGGYVSLSDWLSVSDAWRFEQQYDWTFSSSLMISAGIKYERKDLTKSYMICNYWDGLGYCPAQAATSSNGLTSDGSGVLLAGDISSQNPTSLPPSTSSNIPAFNRFQTTDKGVFVQAIKDMGKWRLNGSIRWDDNSLYGDEINPRGAVIYHWQPQTTFKMVYGEAFQEPSPKDLYGSWSGRDSNADLTPEKVRTVEWIAIHQGKIFLHDISLYYSQYENAIVSSQNIGDREISGIEIRNKFRVENPFHKTRGITGNIYYTYTRAMADQQYENSSGLWMNNRDTQGDIAPHKINFSLNIPYKKHWNINLRANWVSERELFSENPLRGEYNDARTENTKVSSYVKWDANILYTAGDIEVGFKVDNILGENYYHPGVEGAGSGDDFSQDNDGFQNSLLPQVKKRTYSLSVRFAL